MYRVLTQQDTLTTPDLFDQMYRLRAAVFSTRLGWDVTVSGGQEIDRYDLEAEPVYLVTLDDQMKVNGSLRLLNTTGPHMMADEFADYFDEPVDVTGPTIWECTRLCTRSTDDAFASGQLLHALCRTAYDWGVSQIVGIYYRSLARVYSRLGWPPDHLAQSRIEGGAISAGVWNVSLPTLRRLEQRFGSNGSSSHLPYTPITRPFAIA